MNDLLANPAIQSGIIPFIIAFVAALVLKRFGWYWSGLGFALAYYISVYLVTGIQFIPLTSTRKIIVLGILAIVIGLLLDVFKHVLSNVFNQKKYLLSGLIFVASAAAIGWVIWPVVSRQEGATFWMMLLPALLYTGWMTIGSEMLRDKTDQGAILALTTGTGTGVSAILGASALIGQLGIAIGAIAGAYLIISLFKQEVRLGSNFMLPVGLLTGLLGIAAIVYASLPWYSLVPLLVVPAVVHIPVASELSKFKKLLVLAAAALPFALISIVITWMSSTRGESML